MPEIRLDMFIIDVLQHDIENLSSILRLLNNDSCIGWRVFWPHEFSAQEVVPELIRLCSQGLLAAFMVREDDNALHEIDRRPSETEVTSGDLWFSVSKQGNACWDAWEPPTDGT
jgi:hypothetical protein